MRVSLLSLALFLLTSCAALDRDVEKVCEVSAEGEQLCVEASNSEHATGRSVTADEQIYRLDHGEEEHFDEGKDEGDDGDEDFDDDGMLEDDDAQDFEENHDGNGVKQAVPSHDAKLAADTQKLIDEASGHRAESYAKLPAELVDMCTMNHEHCAMWAAMGECDANPKYMKKECAPACKTCDYLSVDHRCPLDPNAKEAWGPGDLDEMFTKITNEPFLSKYDVHVHSRPPRGPWVVTMDSFLNETEASHLAYLGQLEGYVRSTDVGKKKPDGTFESTVSDGRTSTNAWCQNKCYLDEIAQTVIHRISNVTGIDETNSEYLQMLKYEVGQHYKTHHDYIPFDRQRQQGVRILTVFLYLNNVKAGGGTNFPSVGSSKDGLTIMPKKGRALLWPSVLDRTPHHKDSRTMHQALPVEEGFKYGANAWFHMRDFKTPNQNGCQ